MDQLFAKMQSDLTDRLLGLYPPVAPKPAPPSTPLAALLRALDTLTPQARIEKWCVVDMVPGRWEPVTDWLGNDAWAARLVELPPYKLYRVIDKHSRRALEVILTPDGNVLMRKDGRSWLDPPAVPRLGERWLTYEPQRDFGYGAMRRKGRGF